MAEHIFTDKNGLSIDAGPLASQRDLLLGWQDAKSIHEWYNKFNKLMFPEGRIVGVSEEGIVMPVQRFGGLTPLGFVFEMAYNSDKYPSRREDWRYLASKLLKKADPDTYIGMSFGAADRRSKFTYEELNQVPKAHNQLAYRWDGSSVSFREIKPVYPLDFLLEKPWLNSESDWAWVEKNASRSNLQQSLAIPGIEEKSYGLEMAIQAWSEEPLNHKVEYRKPILKAISFLRQNQDEETIKKIAYAAQSIFLSWSKNAKNDATDFLYGLERVAGPSIWKNHGNSDLDFEAKKQEIVSRKERKLLLKKVSSMGGKSSHKVNNAL